MVASEERLGAAQGTRIHGVHVRGGVWIEWRRVLVECLSYTPSATSEG